MLNDVWSHSCLCLIFGNDIAEKIVTSMVHCQTFELSRTQLDPSPDMSNCTFKKKRYPFWTVRVCGRECLKCLMTYDLTLISTISLSKIKQIFFPHRPITTNFFPLSYFSNVIITNQWLLFLFWEIIYAHYFYNIFTINRK